MPSILYRSFYLPGLEADFYPFIERAKKFLEFSRSAFRARFTGEKSNSNDVSAGNSHPSIRHRSDIPSKFSRLRCRELFCFRFGSTVKKGLLKFIEKAVPWKEFVTTNEALSKRYRNSAGPASVIFNVEVSFSTGDASLQMRTILRLRFRAINRLNSIIYEQGVSSYTRTKSSDGRSVAPATFRQSSAVSSRVGSSTH